MCAFLPTTSNKSEKKIVHACYYTQFFTKQLVETKWKPYFFNNCKNYNWSGSRRGGGVLSFFLFLSLFSSLHIYLQYKSKCHRKLFITTANLFSSIPLLIFSNQRVHCFFFKFSFFI